MQLGIAQINPIVGDIAGNQQLILDAAYKMRAQQVDLLLFPELSLTGYPPEDLLLRPAFQQRVDDALEQIRTQVSGIILVIGCPGIRDGQRYNMAIVLRDGHILAEYRKRNLPNYGVFDEHRYFQAGTETTTFRHQGVIFGLAICEDLWHPKPVRDVAAAGATWLLSLHASPFHRGKLAERETQIGTLAERHQLHIAYANQVGGQDELVFDGGSFVADSRGEIIQRCPTFASAETVFDTEPQEVSCAGLAKYLCTPADDKDICYQALVCGTRDYVRKNGFNRVVLGLSGGIDSALTLAIAVDAFGAEQVQAILLPSCYTADISNQDAIAQAEALQVAYQSLPIEPAMQAFETILAPVFAGLALDVTEENIQARSRGLILMAISNKTGAMLLTTGNKSELAVGYATLYGDMNGGFAPLKDVPKMLVYELARWRNQTEMVIPQRVIDRPPSAELRPEQQDSDSLPDYAILDAIVAYYVEQDWSAEQIIATGLDADMVQRMIRLIDHNEYKRRQAAPGVKITRHAFGRERRYPIAGPK